jgi:hypothetical protein
MGAAGVEIPDWINETTVENAYRRALIAQRRDNQGFASKGWRAACARDGRLLKALEGATEVLQHMQERQRGRTMRDASTDYAQRVDLTEYSLWREAYKLCDQGSPSQHFMWIYGAAAELAGY